MFYLTTHLTHFILCYVVSDILPRATQIKREETRFVYMYQAMWVDALPRIYISL